MSNVTQTIATEIASLLSGNSTYNSYNSRWRFLLESYIGGLEYRTAGHLTRYQLETDNEYNARLKGTPLENHCASVINVYNSFLFRVSPTRDFASLEGMPELKSFVEDVDFEGRNINQFMKDVHTWASVFGHCWIMLVKPNVGSTTRAGDQAAGVRPYASLLTPQVVLDWGWERKPSGEYVLSYFKYIEEINGDVKTTKEWWVDFIKTTVINTSTNYIQNTYVEENGLGMIPAIVAYNKRSGFRGIGISDITDIADCQRTIYNYLSEWEQLVRLSVHPSLVMTPTTNAGTGAGSVIEVEADLDPGLKPYYLEYTGGSVSAIKDGIEHAVSAIDKMANTGAVRATESKKISGVAMQTEFELLNARLSEKADNLELAEEQLWQLWASYMDREWTGHIDYPGSFNIRDTSDEINQLKIANEAVDPYSPAHFAVQQRIMEWTGLEDEFTGGRIIPHIMQSPLGELRIVDNQTVHVELTALGWIGVTSATVVEPGESDGLS
jgi:hypothetical protein